MTDGRARTAVVLTAAIHPRACPGVRLRNADERARQYSIALERWVGWCGRHGGTVVFAEGSGADLSNFQNRFARQIRCGDLVLNSGVEDPAVVALGKGNAEASLLARVVEQVLIPGGFDAAIKCTGRLFVSNADRALTLGRTDALQVLIRSDLSRSDSRFFLAPVTFLRDQLASMAATIDEPSGYWFEHSLAGRATVAIGTGIPFVPLRRLPRYAGESASTGARYDTMGTALHRRAHQAARAALHWRGMFL